VASSAGLNRFGVPLLPLITPTTTAVANPLTGYGTLVTTDPSSGTANDSGIIAVEADAYTKWTFQLLGNLAGSGTVQIFSTVDPLAYCVFLANGGVGGVFSGTLKGEFKAGGYTISPGGIVSLPASSWVSAEGPANASGTGNIGNPLGTGNKLFISGYPVVAMRACVTGTFSSGTGSLVVLAAP
jgi:hypothetical protein